MPEIICECGGSIEHDGTMYRNASDTLSCSYRHKCVKCENIYFFPEKYPLVRYIV